MPADFDADPRGATATTAEADRLRRVGADAPSASALDRLTRLAARLLGVAVVVAVPGDAAGQVPASCVGLPEPWSSAPEGPLVDALRGLAASSAACVAVDDAGADPRLRGVAPSRVVAGLACAAAPLRTDDGRVLGALCVLDRRPRRWGADDLETLGGLARAATAEVELRIASERLARRAADVADLLDGTAELVCAVDAGGRITFVNRAWRETLGYADAEIAALRPVDVVAPEHRARYLDTARRLVSGERVDEFEAVLLARDGRRVVCRGRAVPVMADTPDGPRCVGTRSYYRDVTPEHAAEARRARLVAMLDASTDFVGTTTPDGRIAYLNAAGRRMLGLAPDADLTGLRATDFHPPAVRERLGAEALPAATRDGRWAGEGALLAADGTEIPVSMVVVAQPSLAPGEPPYFTAVMRDVRERIAAEVTVARSEARFRAMFESAAVGVTVVDDDGRIVQVNDTFAAFLGYAPDELVGRHAPGLSPGEDAEITREPVRALRRGEASSVSVEKRFIRRDGEVRWVRLAISRILLGDGRQGVLGVTTDITDERRAQQALATERAFLAAMLESLADGVVACDASGRVVVVNRAAREFHGLAGAEAPPERWGAADGLYHPDGETPLAPDEAPLRRALAGEELQDVELVVAARGAGARVVHATGRPIRDARGAGLGAVVAMRDVTAQRAAEEALRQSEARVRTLVEQVSDYAIFRLDAAGRVETWNAGAERLKGYAAPEVVGRPLGVFYPPEVGGAAHAEALLARAAAEGRAEDEGWRLRKDGTRFWAHVVLTALYDARGALAGFAKVTQDRTAQHAAAERLAEREARLALIYNSATDLMFLMRVERDAAGAVAAYRCESVNAAYLAVTGMTPEQLLGRTAAEVLPPPAAAFVLARYAEAERSGAVLRYDETVDLPSGQLILETTLTPVLDEAGRCTHLLGAARDVSATRRAQEALRASEARFRGVLQHLRAPAVQLDASGRVTFVNEALLALAGWTSAEALGADWFAHFVPNGAAARALFADGIRTGVVPVHHEAELLVRGGPRRLVAWDHVALRDPEGQVVGVASVGQDVTDRRELEARLAALSEHDELTGLLNRRGFNRMAGHALRSAARSARHDAVLYIDLDRFKAINDTHGHAAGDDALRAVAEVLRQTVRDADFAARLGGDEFAVFACGLRQGEGHVMAARLRSNLERHNDAAAAAGRPFRVELSVGVAELDAGDTIATLLARGDAALYAQKLSRRRPSGGP